MFWTSVLDVYPGFQSQSGSFVKIIYSFYGFSRQSLCGNVTGTGTDTMPKYRYRSLSYISCSVKVQHNIQWPILSWSRSCSRLSSLWRNHQAENNGDNVHFSRVERSFPWRTLDTSSSRWWAISTCRSTWKTTATRTSTSSKYSTRTREFSCRTRLRPSLRRGVVSLVSSRVIKLRASLWNFSLTLNP